MPSQSSWQKFFANYMNNPSYPSPSVNVVNPLPRACRRGLIGLDTMVRYIFLLSFLFYFTNTYFVGASFLALKDDKAGLERCMISLDTRLVSPFLFFFPFFILLNNAITILLRLPPTIILPPYRKVSRAQEAFRSLLRPSKYFISFLYSY